MLFAATIVEGGGHRASAKDAPVVVIDVSQELGGQHVAPGRMPLGKQSATWTILAASSRDELQEFETPMNGTRILAFATHSSGRLMVLADHVYMDTDANRAVAAAGRAVRGAPWFQLPLFLAAIAIAFAAAFLAWFRVRYGVIALGVSVASWLAYETTISRQTNIRVDLVILFPFLIAAAISIIAAAAYEWRTPSK